jgi:hypothetical protein
VIWTKLDEIGVVVGFDVIADEDVESSEIDEVDI